jgi:hypothetical protein
MITVVELTKQTSILAANIGSWFLPGLLCAAMYLAMSLPLARLARRLERRWGQGARVSASSVRDLHGPRRISVRWCAASRSRPAPAGCWR